MSYTYLLESGEESSAECYSDIPVSVLSRLSLSAEKSYCKDSATESCRNFPSGTTYGLSTGDRGAGKSTVSAGASRAKTFPSRERARGSTESEAGCGGSLRALSARYDRDTRCWRTPQCSLFGGSGECLETLPKSGIMQGGLLWERTTWARPTGASVSGFWRTPTPLASDGSTQQAAIKVRNLRNAKFGARIHSVPYWILKNHNMRCTPTMSEWLMGYPISWTDSAPLATDKFRSWRQRFLMF